jgi:hypothetical protein
MFFGDVSGDIEVGAVSYPKPIAGWRHRARRIESRSGKEKRGRRNTGTIFIEEVLNAMRLTDSVPPQRCRHHHGSK